MNLTNWRPFVVAISRGAGCSLILLMIAVIALPVANAARTLATVPPSVVLPGLIPGPGAIPIRWPSTGEAALGVEGHGVLASTDNPRPLPTASVAKVMTALAVLRARPLRRGEQGPSITITPADVAAYQQDVSQGQSVVAVAAGEQLTEYQALQALLLPSANNIAELLASWAFGSVAAGVTRMNALAGELQLHATHFADASGFNPQTVSTPPDLVALGQEAMHNPVIAEVVSQTHAQLPVAGTVPNVNRLLGQDGILGIKTGNTNEAGGCYLFAAPHVLADGRRLLVIGAVMGLPDLDQALAAAPALVDDARRALELRHVLQAGQVVGSYQAPWGQRVDIVSSRPLDLVLWRGTAVRAAVALRPVAAPLAAGGLVGTVTVSADGGAHRVELTTAASLHEPGWAWRAMRRPPMVPARWWPDRGRAVS
jgi:D-alanyl-D-alanine carboxypeptidase (penicillin-binding protein 5/6)